MPEIESWRAAALDYAQLIMQFHRASEVSADLKTGKPLCAGCLQSNRQYLHPCYERLRWSVVLTVDPDTGTVTGTVEPPGA